MTTSIDKMVGAALLGACEQELGIPTIRFPREDTEGRCSLVILPPHTSQVTHRHPNAEEQIRVLSGSVVVHSEYHGYRQLQSGGEFTVRHGGHHITNQNDQAAILYINHTVSGGNYKEVKTDLST